MVGDCVECGVVGVVGDSDDGGSDCDIFWSGGTGDKYSLVDMIRTVTT